MHSANPKFEFVFSNLKEELQSKIYISFFANQKKLSVSIERN